MIGSRTILLLSVAAACSVLASLRADLWCTAYYAGWTQGRMPAADVDFSALTHVIHFSVIPNPDGTLDSAANGLTPAHSSDAVTHAHAAGKRILICVGGADSQSGFQAAASAAQRATFVNSLTNFMVSRGYDGIDIDWEPLDASDQTLFTDLVHDLRAAMASISPTPLLTAAVASQPALFATLQGQFDQINLMTYDLAGPWPGWVTWFNSPIYDGGYRFPSTHGLIPSADGMLGTFLAAGIDPAKLAVGMAFYGVVWSGGAGFPAGGPTLPRQPWTSAPSTTTVTFDTLMSTYYQPARYHWDTDAQAAYLSIDSPTAGDDRFVSYDDAHSCQAKVSYARNQHLGGVMIWELGTGYRPTQPSGLRDPLLQAVKASLATPSITRVEIAGSEVQLAFTALPLASYRVEWTTNLPSTSWNTLTNLASDASGELQAVDQLPLAKEHRFYRVLTAP